MIRWKQSTTTLARNLAGDHIISGIDQNILITAIPISRDIAALAPKNMIHILGPDDRKYQTMKGEQPFL
jgi:hypothetical protein